MYQVYIQIDEDNKVYNINSNPYIEDKTEWLFVDEGVGEKYLYAQQAYLPKRIYDDNNILMYRYVNNEFVERSEEERLEEFKNRFPETPSNNLDDRVKVLEESLAAYEVAYHQGVNEA